MNPMLTAAELAVLAALSGPRTSDRRVAARAGLSLEVARTTAATLRAKLDPAPGESIVTAARRLGLLGAAC